VVSRGRFPRQRKISNGVASHARDRAIQRGRLSCDGGDPRLLAPRTL